VPRESVRPNPMKTRGRSGDGRCRASRQRNEREHADNGNSNDGRLPPDSQAKENSPLNWTYRRDTSSRPPQRKHLAVAGCPARHCQFSGGLSKREFVRARRDPAERMLRLPLEIVASVIGCDKPPAHQRRSDYPRDRNRHKYDTNHCPRPPSTVDVTSRTASALDPDRGSASGAAKRWFNDSDNFVAPLYPKSADAPMRNSMETQ
jgi:hypothetical protein